MLGKRKGGGGSISFGEGWSKVTRPIIYCYYKITDKTKTFLKRKKKDSRFLTLWVEGTKGNNIILGELLDNILFIYLTKGLKKVEKIINWWFFKDLKATFHSW